MKTTISDLPVATLLLGSNLGDRAGALAEAERRLDALFGESAVERSEILETEAVGFDGPPFLNRILRYRCRIGPEELLDACKGIERQMGRTDPPEYAADGRRIYHNRIIDIDILFLGDLTLHTPRLTLPHPQVTERPFVSQLLCSLD
jgi:2-amino-4-hydroxy-6-hydroxymethyldihydropteridine diphosphokinase